MKGKNTHQCARTKGMLDGNVSERWNINAQTLSDTWTDAESDSFVEEDDRRQFRFECVAEEESSHDYNAFVNGG